MKKSDYDDMRKTQAKRLAAENKTRFIVEGNISQGNADEGDVGYLIQFGPWAARETASALIRDQMVAALTLGLNPKIAEEGWLDVNCPRTGKTLAFYIIMEVQTDGTLVL